MAEPTITAEKLCALTGLTDRRHRQLAKDGWFPAPIRGEYQLTPTIKGLLKYYRTAMEGKQHGQRFKDARDLREEARAEKEQILKDLLKKSVVRVEDATRVITRCAGQVRTRLLAVPAKAAALLEGKDVHQRQVVLRQEIDDALAELQRIRLDKRS